MAVTRLDSDSGRGVTRSGGGVSSANQGSGVATCTLGWDWVATERATSPRTGGDYHPPDEVLVADVGRVAAELGQPPSAATYTEHGVFPAPTIADRFGDWSWETALVRLGHRSGSAHDLNGADVGAVARELGVGVAEETLAADVRRVGDAVGRPPSFKEYADRGAYSATMVAQGFGNGDWVPALEALGYDVHGTRRPQIGGETLRTDVARLVTALGRPPTATEYGDRGHHAATTVSHRFGDRSWPAALGALGYDPAHCGAGSAGPAARDLRRAVDEVATDLGRPPTRAEFGDRSGVDPQTVANRFGNGLWHEALLALDYEPASDDRSRAIAPAALRADLDRVVAAIGHVPTAQTYEDHGEFSAQTVANRFGAGSWLDALAELGYDRPPSGRPAIPAEKLREDVRRVVAELGETPTIAAYEALGDYSYRPVADRFGGGSWPAALRKLGYK